MKSGIPIRQIEQLIGRQQLLLAVSSFEIKTGL